MKIFIACSKRFYGCVPPIQAELEAAGHEIALPNCIDDPGTEQRMYATGGDAHSAWKGSMLKHSAEVIEHCDGVLVLNLEKDGVAGYIGGATFLEMYDAFRLGKKIYVYEPIANNILTDEIDGFASIVLDRDLSRIL